jgi:hypothetical protein
MDHSMKEEAVEVAAAEAGMRSLGYWGHAKEET